MLNNPAYSRPLRAPHTAEVACSHEGIDDLIPAGRRQDHLRCLLIQAWLLEPLDLHLRRYETWCEQHIEEMAATQSRDVMRLYARWS